VLLDTWDLETLARGSADACTRCAVPRVERLRAASRTGCCAPPIACGCDANRGGHR
jgi:hypothetical protein